MDRRRFLQVGTAAGVAAAVGGRIGALATPTAPARRTALATEYIPVDRYPSGVASGDPTAEGVVLWTRIDPAVAGAGIAVDWEVADDPGFAPASIVASGTETTTPATDHTVHVEVGGLGAGATRWYRFTAGGVTSPVGRTKTLPAATDRARLAFFSCQRWVHGYYTAHADLAALATDPATDLDLVVCLGDYVYEPGPADGVTVPGRIEPDGEMLTLDDHRRQYHWYRNDPDLQAMHAAYPVVAIFDNHDGMRDPSDPAGPGARAAFFEQQAVRRDPAQPDRQHRSFALGSMVDLFLLDERQYRDPTPSEASGNAIGTSTLEQPEMVEPGRSMLGDDQRAWLLSGLSTSTASWKLLGSQLMFSPLRSQRFTDAQEAAGDGPQRNAGRYVNTTQWDGYQAERRTILDHLRDAEIDDVIALAGDTHFWTTSEVPVDYDDPASPLVLTEFGGSSISSANAGAQTNLPGNDVVRPVVAEANPYTLRFMDVETHGYGVIELTAERASVWYRSPATITEPTASSSVLAAFEVDRGTARIRQVAGEGFMARPDDPGQTGPVPGAVEPPAAGAVAARPRYTG